jgi:glucosamine--fructose-6-phosphate aminotransferase (isomerizing)
VASTKAFTGQVVILTCLALHLAHERKTLPAETLVAYVRELAGIPAKVEQVLAQKEKVLELSRAFRFASSFLYLGRGFNYPVALEGALKLKEISYIHAEGYAAAEMKHGPIALIDKFMPVVIIAPCKDHSYDKVRSNIQEVLARQGSVIALTDDDNHDLDDICEGVLRIPQCSEFLSPLLTVIPLQLLSYYIADLRRCEIDQPRNLAKSVTVE